MFTYFRQGASSRRLNRAGSHLALAIALIAGSGIAVTSMAETAHAKERKRDSEKPAKADYSKEFIAAYNTTNPMVSGEARDLEAARASVPALVAALSTADDKNAAGGLIFNIGNGLDDSALQLQGIELMISSGKNDQAKLGQFNFAAYQIYRELDQLSDARNSLQSAIDADYRFTGQLADGSTKNFGPADLKVMLAELYFEDNLNENGFDYLQNLIDETVAAGNLPEEAWLRRGFSVAYGNDNAERAEKFGAQGVQYYPSADNWVNALAVLRNFSDMDNSIALDVMRLAERTGAMKNGRDYADYIEAADPRRLPGEVDRIVKAGIAAGLLESSDVFVTEARSVASGAIAADKADMPSLEADARKASSNAVTATAAGDVFLSYDLAAKSEELYAIAATKPGADLDRINLRLGIAQTDLGKFDAALASFGKVGGTRAKSAKLWSIYAQNQADAAATVEAVVDAVEAVGDPVSAM